MKQWFEFNPQGFALSNNELFCIFPDNPVIAVYNIETFASQRTISVQEMNHPFDMVASENVLYVSEREDKLIHRIQLPEETVSNWTVDGTWLKLSISKDGNVIAASLDQAKILEYASDGTFVREIVVNRIDPDLIGLRHAIQLEGDKFLVCHAAEDTHHRVCLIDNTGKVIQCYGGSSGSGMGQLNLPYHLAIGRNGSILVADLENNRIVQLNKSLEYVNEFTGFKQPFRLLINKELGRLYAIEESDCSITIMYCISTKNSGDFL